jgi:hypothetical protein
MATAEQIAARMQDARIVANHFKYFEDFYRVVSVELIGFEPSDMQYDIARFVAYGPDYCMVQAQRGEAKSTITACYAIWSLMQDPTLRIVIISAGSKVANQIMNFCIQILYGLEFLAPFRPDKHNPGTRTNMEEYDIHHDLKGVNKSPSLSCMGVTASKQGYRSDILIADDVESQENSMTQKMRAVLRERTRDFSSIDEQGRIIYLGTPQTVDSIYNDLPARGFDVKIWPGRYPTVEEEKNYGNNLAPFITERMKANPSLRSGGGLHLDRGQPTDSVMKDEETLCAKERDQGKAYFNLQFMLDTALSDADRYPLKLNHLSVYSFDLEEAPSKIIWSNDPSCAIPNAVGSPIPDTLYRPARISEVFSEYPHRLLVVDPAGGGQNGDETGVVVLFAANGYYAVMDVIGVPGGAEEEKLQKIVQCAVKWRVSTVLAEKNYGNGMFTNALITAFRNAEVPMNVEEVYSKGQKEQRIADTVEPVLGSHRLVLNAHIPEQEVRNTQKYATDKRSTYNFLFQMKYLTRERQALVHDDKLDALSIGIDYLNRVIMSEKEDKRLVKTVSRLFQFKQDCYGKWRYANRVDDYEQYRHAPTQNVMDRFKRR